MYANMVLDTDLHKIKVYTIIVMLLSLPHYSYRNEMQGSER